MTNAYVLMGYPGSGKSTLLSQLANPETDLCLSSDNIREELFGFRDQEHNQEVFATLYQRAIDYTGTGNIYIDATNLSRKDRAKTIEKLRKHYSLHLICVLRPITEIIEVNAQRLKDKPDAYIPDDILKHILGKFQFPTYSEGWDEIQFCYNATKLELPYVFDYNALEDIAHDNPHHKETIKEHIDFINRTCMEQGKSPQMCEIARYHDLGKFFTKVYNKEKGYSQTMGHAAVSAYIYLVDHITYMLHMQQQFGGKLDEQTMFSFGFITSYYGIYYHDLPYEIHKEGLSKEEEINLLIKSLKKPSKGIVGMYKKFGDDIVKDPIEFLANLLYDFNQIDRMREGDVNGDI